MVRSPIRSLSLATATSPSGAAPHTKTRQNRTTKSSSFILVRNAWKKNNIISKMWSKNWWTLKFNMYILRKKFLTKKDIQRKLFMKTKWSLWWFIYVVFFTSLCSWLDFQLIAVFLVSHQFIRTDNCTLIFYYLIHFNSYLCKQLIKNNKTYGALQKKSIDIQFNRNTAKIVFKTLFGVVH